MFIRIFVLLVLLYSSSDASYPQCSVKSAYTHRYYRIDSTFSRHLIYLLKNDVRNGDLDIHDVDNDRLVDSGHRMVGSPYVEDSLHHSLLGKSLDNTGSVDLMRFQSYSTEDQKSATKIKYSIRCN